MIWQVYRVIFKLRSPIHIGCGKVGNLQRTRPYITGRMFWGALTMRLTRDECEKEHKPAINSADYQKIGEKVHDSLAYTYFYPAINKDGDYQINWSWNNNFRHRFLSSYVSTALLYPQQTAAEGLLHEVEFLSPRRLDTGEQVYLVGYVFEKNNCQLAWKQAIRRLHLGGERSYGWGMVELVDDAPYKNKDLFDGQAVLINSEDRFVIQTERLLAHTSSTNFSATGEMEPLVGREWKSPHQAGQHIEQFGDPCWVPGITVKRSKFTIQKFGIWFCI